MNPLSPVSIGTPITMGPQGAARLVYRWFKIGHQAPRSEDIRKLPCNKSTKTNEGALASKFNIGRKKRAIPNVNRCLGQQIFAWIIPNQI
jgi:hypothetical protein